MKLQDVLHFYLGAKVKAQDGEMIYTLSGIDRKGNALFYDGFGNEMWLSPGWKLMLRKLDSMTEQEAIECAKLSEWEPDFVNPVVKRTKYNDLVVEWADGHEKQNVTGDLFWCPEQVVYLCAKGFDIFNLIPMGQAIDATIQGQ